MTTTAGTPHVRIDIQCAALLIVELNEPTTATGPQVLPLALTNGTSHS